MWGVRHHVCVRRIMDRGDLTMADTECLVDDLHHGREAVGGAGCRRDDRVIGGIIEMMVDADDDVENVVLLDRRRHDHPPGSALQMPVERRVVQELAAAFEHHVDAEVSPRNVSRGGEDGKSEPPLADANCSSPSELMLARQRP